MVFTGERGQAWADEKRESVLVFIGRAPLPRELIKEGFAKCNA